MHHPRPVGLRPQRVLGLILAYPALSERPFPPARLNSFSGNNRPPQSVSLLKHSAANSQISPVRIVLGGYADRSRFAPQEQAAQFPHPARHHSRHHHADRRHRPHPRDESVHRREGLQHGLRRFPRGPHGVVRPLRSQEVHGNAEAESADPAGRIRVRQGPRHSAQRHRHDGVAQRARLLQGRQRPGRRSAGRHR